MSILLIPTSDRTTIAALCSWGRSLDYDISPNLLPEAKLPQGISVNNPVGGKPYFNCLGTELDSVEWLLHNSYDYFVESSWNAIVKYVEEHAPSKQLPKKNGQPIKEDPVPAAYILLVDNPTTDDLVYRLAARAGYDVSALSSKSKDFVLRPVGRGKNVCHLAPTRTEGLTFLKRESTVYRTIDTWEEFFTVVVQCRMLPQHEAEREPT